MKVFSRLLLCCSLVAAPLGAQQVAITFDDLPLHGDLPPGESRLQVARSILETIRREHLPPVYGFINAVDMQDDPALIDVLTAWRAAGQPLGNHTYSHKGLNKLSVAAFERDIEKNEPTLSSVAAGSDWRWLRYPYLWEGDNLDKRHAIFIGHRDVGHDDIGGLRREEATCPICRVDSHDVCAPATQRLLQQLSRIRLVLDDENTHASQNLHPSTASIGCATDRSALVRAGAYDIHPSVGLRRSAAT